MVHLPSEILNLGADELFALADYHRRLSDTFMERGARAAELEAMRRRSAQRVQSLHDSYKTVLAFLSEGYNSEESAIEAAARTLDMPVEAVAGWWKAFKKRCDQQAVRAREQACVDLAAVGATNKEIAARLGIHRNTVSRMLRRRLHGTRPKQ